MVTPPFSLSDLPQKPGCYFFKDIAGDIIYIGKANNLRKRVSSYFTKDVDTKTSFLLSEIRDVEVIVTSSEVEALLLESNQIKLHKPKFNIELKYGVRYAWIVLTDEEYPRLLTTRSKNISGEYFGPFTNGQLRRMLIKTLQEKFFIRTCKTFPKKPCLRYHLEICKAPCVDYQSYEEYRSYVTRVRSYLRGDNDSLIAELESEMHLFSSRLEFEKAQERKDQIEALRYLQQRFLVENERLEDQDVIGYQRYHDDRDYTEKCLFLVFSYRKGVLHHKQEFTVALEEDVLDTFLKRYYETASLPREILLTTPLKDTAIIDFLHEKAGRKVSVTVPQRGLKRELVQMLEQNLATHFSKEDIIAREIMDQLDLDNPIHTIECFDISHLSGSYMVGAMSFFRDGKPVKGNYRRFKIKTVQGIDDFRAIAEVVERRYARLKQEGGPYPDLILIDGGAIQVDFAYKALQEVGLSIPLIGIAKKFEELYVPLTQVSSRFDKNSSMMKILIQARDEAHRFGVSYHRQLRSKGQTSS